MSQVYDNSLISLQASVESNLSTACSRNTITAKLFRMLFWCVPTCTFSKFAARVSSKGFLVTTVCYNQQLQQIRAASAVSPLSATTNCHSPTRARQKATRQCLTISNANEDPKQPSTACHPRHGGSASGASAASPPPPLGSFSCCPSVTVLT